MTDDYAALWASMVAVSARSLARWMGEHDAAVYTRADSLEGGEPGACFGNALRLCEERRELSYTR